MSCCLGHMGVCVSRACLAHADMYGHGNTHKQVQLVDSGEGLGEAQVFTPADFKLPGTPRKHQRSQDEGLYKYVFVYKCVCVVV